MDSWSGLSEPTTEALTYIEFWHATIDFESWNFQQFFSYTNESLFEVDGRHNNTASANQKLCNGYISQH